MYCFCGDRATMISKRPNYHLWVCSKRCAKVSTVIEMKRGVK